ncbi:MAG TPA: ABC transporter permease [Candidatus Bipolaricaulis sp.]|nr:ABC transporter permease [Candidatus Bipolaricaulis sp.]HRS13765.1 ABC transporter permease [Candidatus Bipolaricaulis sp.]HRU21527.1 ABC transporter permease [Candidatus Bipolaricaulis sp.]
MVRDFMALAGSSILHRRIRSWLTVIGVFIGITAVVALISIGLGLERTVNDEVAKLFGVDTFLLAPRQRSNSGRSNGLAQYMLDLEWLRTVDGVATAAAVRQRTAFVEGQAGPDGRVTQGFLPVLGLSPELVTSFPAFIGSLELEPGGRLFGEDETLVAVLGKDVATRLHVEVGETIVIAGDGDKPELTLTVIGIVAPTAEPSQQGFTSGISPSGDTIYVPYGTMDLLWGPANDVLTTLVRTEPGRDVDEVAARVQVELRARGSEVTAVTYSDISSAIGTVTSTVSAFLAGIAGISLLVGGVGVMNTMYTSVLERTKEIGIMKAVGAKNSHILSIFLIESGLMGLVGGIVGTLLGLGVSSLASAVIGRIFDVRVAVVVSPSLIVATLAGAFALGAVAGLWPAWRAAKLPVVDALRYE